MGYAVVLITGGRRAQVQYVECGVIGASPRAPLEVRLAEITRGLTEVIEELEPEVAAVEDIFYSMNARSALALGHARGAALAVAGMAGLRVYAYPPAVVKKTVTGNGRATKRQVGEMVRHVARLCSVPGADAADALAVAVTHARLGPMSPLAPSLARVGAHP